MRASLFLIPALLSSVACSSQDDYARRTGVSNDPAARASTSAGAAQARAEAVSIRQTAEKDGGNWQFEYGWPKAVSAQPALAKQLAAEKDKALAAEKAEWDAALADAPADCVSCKGRSYGKLWEVVADLPDWLSLSASISTYTGGAHGNYGMQSLVWDKTRKASMDGVALFRSPAALQQALGPALCEALNRARVKKGAPPITEPESIFPACSPLTEATVLVGSGNGRAFDRITIYYGPYVAGSFAEGAYELNFPVDAKVLGAVKDEYRGAFAGR